MYLYVRIDAWDTLAKKRKKHPPLGDDACTVEAAPNIVGRDEQGEARRANTAPKGGPHLELERFRLKTWSKSDFSIADTTWPTYVPVHIFTRGASPRRADAALAPRMPVVT